MRNPQRPVKKNREQHHGRAQSFRNQPWFILSWAARAAAPASQATVGVSQASSFSSPRFVHKLNATVKTSRTLMLAAIFSFYGNGTRPDRFIPLLNRFLGAVANYRHFFSNERCSFGGGGVGACSFGRKIGIKFFFGLSARSSPAALAGPGAGRANATRGWDI